MKAPKSPHFMAELRRAVGPIEVVPNPERGGFMFLLECEQCPSPVRLQFANLMPPDQIEKRLKREGWTLGRHRLCPSHAKPERNDTVPPAPSPVLKAVPPAPQQPQPQLPAPQGRTGAEVASDKAKAAKRSALQWLDEAFNIERGQYRAGISDKTVATESGLAEAEVKRLREEFYGALREPGEIETVRAALRSIDEHLRAEIERLHTTVQKAMHSIPKLVEQQERGVREISARLADLARKNGWVE